MAGEAERSLWERLGRLKHLPLLHRTNVSGEERRLRDQLDSVSRADASEDEIWAFVELARHPDRPYTLDYVERILEDWVELHGDRGRADDGAIVAGLGKLDGRTVALIGHQKGRDLKERLARQYGMPSPEGYSKAMRIMDIAERFDYPLISLVDTPGAFPGVAAEQHGQGGAIARSQARMMALPVPTIACVIGEGGSGGALALAVSDRVMMQENAIYSVITPEGCAMIHCLQDLALGPQHAVVAVPGRAVAGQPGRQPGVAAVQPVRLGGPVRVVEHARVVGPAEQRMVQAAGRHQAAGKPAEPAEPGQLAVPGPDQADRRQPGQRLAVDPGAADVKAPVDQDLELETSTRPAAQHPYAAFGAIPALDQPHPGHLLQPAHPGEQFLPGPPPPPEGHHRQGLLEFVSSPAEEHSLITCASARD